MLAYIGPYNLVGVYVKAICESLQLGLKFIVQYAFDNPLIDNKRFEFTNPHGNFIRERPFVNSGT